MRQSGDGQSIEERQIQHGREVVRRRDLCGRWKGRERDLRAPVEGCCCRSQASTGWLAGFDIMRCDARCLAKRTVSNSVRRCRNVS
jgi:hypothetical protein